MVRSLILFLHVASAMTIVAAFGVEGLALLQLRRARSIPDLRDALGNFRYVQWVGASGLIGTVVTGIYLASAYWRWQGAWMGTGFAALVVNAIIGATVTSRPVTVARRGAAEGTAMAAIDALRAKLALSFALRAAIVVGIVFLMTVKPATWPTSLLDVGAAAALGLLISLPLLRQPAPRSDGQR